MDLSRKIVMLRERRGWTQIDLARAAGIPQPTICRLESGHIEQPKMLTLAKIAKALRVPADYLASDEYDSIKVRLADVPEPRIVVE